MPKGRSGAIYYRSTVNDAAALTLVRGTDYLNALTEAQCYLGWWLILNGATWIVISFANMFLPAYVDTINSWSLPFQLGEIAFMLWLLVMGAKESKA